MPNGSKSQSGSPQAIVGELAAEEVQELGDVMHKLLTVSAKQNAPMRFHVRIELGDGKTKPSDDAAKQMNALLKNVKEGLELK